MCENTAKLTGGNYIELRFFDVLNPKKEETRTEQEIIDHVLSRGWGGEKK
jgi:hypothetical protein